MIFFISLVEDLIFFLGILTVFIIIIMCQFSFMYFQHSRAVLFILEYLLKECFGYEWVVSVACDRLPQVFFVFEDLYQPLRELRIALLRPDHHGVGPLA